MFRVTTPVVGFTGVSAGVNFTDGVAQVDGDKQAAALRYFRQAGYLVEEADADGEPVEADTEESSDKAPKKSATTEVWRTYCVKQGLDPEKAAEMSRDQCIEWNTSKEETPS